MDKPRFTQTEADLVKSALSNNLCLKEKGIPDSQYILNKIDLKFAYDIFKSTDVYFIEGDEDKVNNLFYVVTFYGEKSDSYCTFLLDVDGDLVMTPALLDIERLEPENNWMLNTELDIPEKYSTRFKSRADFFRWFYNEFNEVEYYLKKLQEVSEKSKEKHLKCDTTLTLLQSLGNRLV